ncbi:MAG TPA: sigma factor, partial [Acidimicrobiales bacterium]
MADVQDLERLYREHYRSLVRLAAILIDDVATCEELVQDAFVAVLRRTNRWVGADKAPAYLRSAV